MLLKCFNTLLRWKYWAGRELYRLVMDMKQIVMVFLLMGWAGIANAQGRNVLCVYCQEPDKTYRCSVIGSGEINPKITRLYCIIKTAKEQGHASCRIRQEKDRLCLNSTEVTYLYEGPNIPGLTTRVDKGSEIQQLEQKNRLVKKKKEPGTLVEFTKQSLNQSGQTLKKAGQQTKNVIGQTGKVIKDGAKGVGGVVKGAGDFLLGTTVKTVKCIFTLFTKWKDPEVNTSSAEAEPGQNDVQAEQGIKNSPLLAEKPVQLPPVTMPGEQ